MRKVILLTVLLTLVVFLIPAHAGEAKDMEIVGPLPLPIDGTVIIGNEDPIKMEIVNGDTSVRIPVHWSNSTVIGGSFAIVTYTVPTGMQLIIDNFTIVASMPSGQNVFGFEIRTTLNGDLASHFFSMSKQGTSGGFDSFVGGKKVLLFADGGSEVSAILLRSDASGDANFTFSFTGFLEPLTAP